MAIMAMLFLYQTTFAVAIGPIKSFYNATPGETIYGNIVVINIDKNVNKTPQVEIAPTSTDNSKSDISGWISFPEQEAMNKAIAPGDRAAIIYQIDIPQDATPGEYYGKILVSDISTPTDATSAQTIGIGLNFQISHLIYIKIKGEDVASNVIFEDFNITKNNETNTWDFISTFSNNGDLHDIPTGNILIFENNNEGTVSVTPIIAMDLNSNQKGVMQKTQTITTTYGKTIPPGDYTAIIKTKTTNNAAEARVNFTINENQPEDSENFITLSDQEITPKNPDDIQLQDLSTPKNLTAIEVKQAPSIRFSHAVWVTLLFSLGLTLLALRLTSKPKNK